MKEAGERLQTRVQRSAPNISVQDPISIVESSIHHVCRTAMFAAEKFRPAADDFRDSIPIQSACQTFDAHKHVAFLIYSCRHHAFNFLRLGCQRIRYRINAVEAFQICLLQVLSEVTNELLLIPYLALNDGAGKLKTTIVIEGH